MILPQRGKSRLCSVPVRTLFAPDADLRYAALFHARDHAAEMVRLKARTDERDAAHDFAHPTADGFGVEGVLQPQYILQDPALNSVLVFTNTKHGADRVVKELGRGGIAAMAIHGNKGQTARVKALESFKSGEIRVLVATDIAARGIDVNELGCVINYELPNVPETYVHRIGRTGRAGRSGIAISFCNFDELAYLKDIEKLIAKKVPVVEGHPWPMEIFEATPKAVRPPRPPRAERQKQATGGANASDKPTKSTARTEKAPAAAAPAVKKGVPVPEQPLVSARRPSGQREAPAAEAPLPPPEVAAPQPPKIRRLSSDPRPIGRLMASADGRRKRRSRNRQQPEK